MNEESKHEYTRLVGTDPKVTVTVTHDRDGESSVALYRERVYRNEHLTITDTAVARSMAAAIIEGANWIDQNGPVIYPGVVSPSGTACVKVSHHYPTPPPEPAKMYPSQWGAMAQGAFTVLGLFTIGSAIGYVLARVL